MDVYKEIYLKHFQKMTDVIAQLQAAQREAEELYISREEEAGDAGEGIDQGAGGGNDGH